MSVFDPMFGRRAIVAYPSRGQWAREKSISDTEMYSGLRKHVIPDTIHTNMQLFTHTHTNLFQPVSDIRAIIMLTPLTMRKLSHGVTTPNSLVSLRGVSSIFKPQPHVSMFRRWNDSCLLKVLELVHDTAAAAATKSSGAAWLSE